MDKSNSEISNKLRELRISHGYTQSYIADNIDIKQPTYQQYESGKRTPNVTTIYKIANFYGLTADELLKLCIPLDNDIYYDAPLPTKRSLEEAELVSFSTADRVSELKANEVSLLFYFSKLDEDEQKEVIDFTKFKLSQKKQPWMK